ncbi:hypothetical protein ABXV16_16965 [Pantoea leporis]|uniref:Uncharacterized protein n=1 Tax=Pantoea leporis TaxID=2933780 RepID=A0ABV2E2D5_9GAMM
MSHLLKTPAARDWINGIIKKKTSKIFGKIKGAVIWTDEKNEEGHYVVPIAPLNLIDEINTNPLILLNGHDPGKPIGQIIKSAYFESEKGVGFIAAVVGFYAGGQILEFNELNLELNETVKYPSELPELPDNTRIDFAVDPREVDAEWLEKVTSISPVPVKHIELSHNSSEILQELIRVGLPYLVLVWNPFTTAIASEAGKNVYAGFNKWTRELLRKLAEKRAPILSIQSFQQECQVSFLFRGKDINLNYRAHDSLPGAAVQAAELISKLSMRNTPARELTYEFDKDSSKWYPSFAILNNNIIVTDTSKLIALEQLPSELSLGISLN